MRKTDRQRELEKWEGKSKHLAYYLFVSCVEGEKGEFRF